MSVHMTEAIIMTSSCQTMSLPDMKLDEDVNIRIWRFAAEQELPGLHEEKSSVVKPIRGPER